MQSQENTESDKIKSKTGDDEGVDLQIYRTTIRPTNYLSFQGKLYKTLAISNQNSFTDSIVPNIKFYYLFRYVNKHGVPSNVSSVYEVEMKEEDGYFYLNSSIVDLERKPKKTQQKDLKRYLLIRPSVIQTQLKDKENINTVEDINLGPKDK